MSALTRYFLLLSLSAFVSARADTTNLASNQDLSKLSLQELLNIEVVSVSKFSQKAANAPSDVTVISADEIRNFGWRTLADVLGSARSFNITSDRLYSYAGVRGFAPLGDYNNRLLLMIDGIRINDNVYDQAMLGSEFSLNLDMVDHVEIVRGPGSSMYGNNALFGIINLITKRGQEVGKRLTISADTLKSGSVQGSMGGRLDNDAEYLISASHEYAPGEKLTFPEFAPGNTVTSGTDSLHNSRLFSKFSQGGFGVMVNLSKREKLNPAALSSGLFDDPRNKMVDQQGFFDGHYTWSATQSTEWTARLFAGSHQYNGDYVYNDPVILNRDFGRGDWLGGEFKGDTHLGIDHRLVYGVELQRNTRQRLYNYDVDPYYLYHDTNKTGFRKGYYVQDEWHMNDALNATVGARFDQVTGINDQVSPRLALVWHSNPDTIWKSSYGTAFRAPTAFESFTNRGRLLPERIQTLELSFEHYLSSELHMTVVGYDYRMENQIASNPDYDPASPGNYYINLPQLRGRGFEIEAEKLWDGGARLRTSLDIPYLRDDQGQWPINSPKWNFKLNHAQPLDSHWTLGMEEQIVGPQRSNLGQLGSSAITNLTLSRRMGSNGWEFSATIRDLFDRRPDQPVLEDYMALNARDTVPNVARNINIRLVRRF